jgi:RNA polymerase primary sigma factor
MRQIKITQSITNRESESLEKYLTEISKEQMITAEEEVQLAIQIQKGCSKSLDKLTKANLRFVVSVAKQYQNSGLSLSDLINEGNIGLIKACYKYDPSKGFKFISYAVWWIRQSILQALSDQSRLVRIPMNKVSLNGKVRKAISHLEQEFERDPSSEEIANMLELNINDIEAARQYNHKHVSMDAPVGGESEDTVADMLNIASDSNIDIQFTNKNSLLKEVQRHLNVLNARQKEILCSFYGIGNSQELTLEEMGEKYGLTRERVRQIKDKAISILKTQGNNNLLRSYLG